MTYTIDELCGMAWNSAVENVAEMEGYDKSEVWGFNGIGWTRFEADANRHGMRFDENGNIVEADETVSKKELEKAIDEMGSAWRQAYELVEMLRYSDDDNLRKKALAIEGLVWSAYERLGGFRKH